LALIHFAMNYCILLIRGPISACFFTCKEELMYAVYSTTWL
jgi:hypothetical protein